jgi:hypothetical protein
VRMILRSHWLPYCNRPVLRTALPPPSEEKGSLSKVSARNGDIGIYPSEYSCSFCFACSARSAVCGRCRAFFLRVQAASDSGEPPVQPAMPRLNTYFKMSLVVIFEESPPIVEPQEEGEMFNIVVFDGLACTCSHG